MPPFQRKTLVLVGANGVGRRSLKEKLIKSDPRRFASALPRKFNKIKKMYQKVERENQSTFQIADTSG